MKSKINNVAYRLTLLQQLSGAHNVFHVSMLEKYVPDPTHILQYEPLEIKENAAYVQKSVQIIDMKEQLLRTRTIHWVKVLWENHSLEEITWDLRDQILKKCPHLLPEVRLIHLEDQMS